MIFVSSQSVCSLHGRRRIVRGRRERHCKEYRENGQGRRRKRKRSGRVFLPLIFVPAPCRMLLSALYDETVKKYKEFGSRTMQNLDVL